MTENPLISIITPSYNHARYLRETIESVLSQQGLSIEHIVVDGGSNDGTVDILKEYEARYPGRFRWVSERDRGQSHAFNKGLAMASGAIIGWQNSDDFYYPGTLDMLAQVLEAYPNVDVVYGDSTRVDENSLQTGMWQGQKYNYRTLLKSNYIPNQAALIRKQAIDNVGGLREGLHYTMDYDLWLRLGVHHEMRYLPERIGAYRILSSAKSSTGWAQNRREASQLLRELSVDPELSPETRELATSRALKYGVEGVVATLTDDSSEQTQATVRKMLEEHPELLNWELLLDECMRDALRTVEESGGRYKDMVATVRSLTRLVSEIRPIRAIPYPQILAARRLICAIQGEGAAETRLAHVLGAMCSYPPLFLNETAWGATMVGCIGKEATDGLRKSRVRLLRLVAQLKRNEVSV